MTRLRRRNLLQNAGAPQRARGKRRAAYGLALLLGAALGVAEGRAAGDALLQRALPPQHFRAQQMAVQITGAESAAHVQVRPRELLARAGINAGTPLREIHARRAQLRAALRLHPWLADARVAVLPPDTVLVRLQQRRPMAVAKVAGALRYVDRDGLAFARAAADAAGPHILGVAEAAADAPHPLLAQAVQLLAHAAAQPKLPPPAHVLMGGRAPEELPALVWPREGAAPLRALVGGADVHARLARLARMWRSAQPELRAELRQSCEVDLRFDKQLVLRPCPKPAGPPAPQPL